MPSGVKNNAGSKTEAEAAPRDGRSRRWDRHRAARRAEFVTAAVSAINRYGPEVRVEQIAEQAGVPRPVLYRHFKDRADLDAAIAQHAAEHLLAQLAPVLSPRGTAHGAIDAVVRTYLGWVEAAPELYRFVVHRAGRAEADGTRSAIERRATELLTAYFRWYGAESPVLAPLTAGLVALVDAAVDRSLRLDAEPVDRDLLADRLVAAVWQVIAGEAEANGIQVDPDTPLPGLGDLLAAEPSGSSEPLPAT